MVFIQEGPSIWTVFYTLGVVDNVDVSILNRLFDIDNLLCDSICFVKISVTLYNTQIILS